MHNLLNTIKIKHFKGNYNSKDSSKEGIWIRLMNRWHGTCLKTLNDSKEIEKQNRTIWLIHHQV